MAMTKSPDAESVWKEYQKGLGYNTQLGLYTTVRTNESFFIGKQWEGVLSNGLPTPVFNFLKRVVLFTVAGITSNTVKLQASVMGSAENAGNTGSAYRIRYGQLTLVTGALTAAFYVETINKGIGGSGFGQARLIENHPRTLDGRSIYEWVPTSTSGDITADQRNAQRISGKVEATMRALNLTTAMTFYDKIGHEYYVIDSSAEGGGVAIVQNTENGAWYIYRNFPAVCMIVYKDEVYYGTADGYLRHFSHVYRHDCGAEIACCWESGAESFGKNFMRKYTDELYIVPKQEEGAFVNVALLTDEGVSPGAAQIVATGFFSFLELGFDHLSFNVCRQPKTHRKKFKARGYTWLKLIFSSVSTDTTVTILSASIKVRETGKVR